MIPRHLAPVLRESATRFPVLTLLGPRQSGKTTLVKAVFPRHDYLNLENPETRAIVSQDPKTALHGGAERMVIDEVQRLPEVLSWVQVFVDRNNDPGQFVLTGSNQPELGAAISQSLAGRTSIHHLLPLSLEELAASRLGATRDEILLSGCLPRLYDAAVAPSELYSAYFATYVERDVRRLVNVRDLSRFETFVRLLAGRAGQLLNLSAIAGDVGVSSTTLAGWLSALEAAFVVFRLPAYHGNLRKRLVKTPKLYFHEPGLLAWLLQIETQAQMARDPLLGHIYENLVVTEAMKAAFNRGREPRLSFYRDKTGMEVDLIREVQRKPFAVEIKAGATYVPDMVRSLKKFEGTHPDAAATALVYSGDSRGTIDGVEVVNHVDVGRLLFEGS